MGYECQYECRVTIAYVWGADCVRLLCDAAGFTESEGEATAHDESYTRLLTRMLALCKALLLEGFVITRYEISEVLLDSRAGDQFGFLID